MQISRIALVAACATLAACATTPATTSTSTQASTTKPKAASATRITADEAIKLNVPTAYQVVNRLHPQWFRHTSGEGTLVPLVYINNQRQQDGLESLKLVPTADIIQIDYSKASEAIMKYGPDAKGGAILVSRK